MPVTMGTPASWFKSLACSSLVALMNVQGCVSTRTSPAALADRRADSALSPKQSSPIIASAHPAPSARTPLSAVDYVFTVDDTLSTLATRVCMHGSAPAGFGADPDSMRFLRNPRLQNGATETPLGISGGWVQLGNAAANPCIAYDIDLRAASASGDWLLSTHRGPTFLGGVALFLFRPSQTLQNARVTAHFELPAGISLSVPWLPDATSSVPNTFVLDDAAFGFTGHVAIGRFQTEHVAPTGADFQVSVIGEVPEHLRKLIAPWVLFASSSVAQVTGHFPIPRVQVIAAAGEGSSWPFLFGHTGRSGGGSILFYMPSQISEAELHKDWVAIHEFCHLLHPFVERNDAWLSEGLATYLQEVVMARAGVITPLTAWQTIHEGSLYTRDAVDTLERETVAMPYAHNYKRVYWGGAMLMLMADVALRERSANAMSLDRVLAKIGEDPDNLMRTYSGAALIAEMDRASESSVFSDLVARYLRSPHYPQLDELYARLGVQIAHDRVTSLRKGALTSVRDAIMHVTPR